MPDSRITSNAREGFFAFIVFTHSSRTRSALTFLKVSSVGAIAAKVPGSRSNSSVAENRAARRTRRPSSEKRSIALPTARIDLRSMSFRPSNGSTSAPFSGSAAIALIVKSRRARSAVMSFTKLTLSG